MASKSPTLPVQLKFSLLILNLILLIVFRNNWQINLFLAFLATSLVLLTPKTNKDYLKRYPAIFFVLVGILCFNLFFFPGELEIKIVVTAIAVFRIQSLLSISLWFTLSTPPKNMLILFGWFPSRFRLALTITFSLIPLVLTEFKKIQTAQYSRAFKPSIWQVWKNWIPLVVPLLYRTLLRAEQMALSLESRGGD